MLKSVEKSLIVLEELNRHPVRRVSDLKAATGISAPTLVRILEVLCQAGYVRKISRWSGYCLTSKVLSLSVGYKGLPKVFEQAQKEADDLTRRLQWPAAICTFETDAMVVRYSTISASPLSHKRSTINRRLEMLTRAHGRAWLAFCEEPMRLEVWERLVQSGHHTGTTEQLEAEMKPILDEVRRAGIAGRDPMLDADTHTLAVPIFVDGALIGTMGITYFSRVVRNPGAICQELKAATARLDSSASGD